MSDLIPHEKIEILAPGQDPVLEALNRAAEEVTPADIEQIITYLRKARGAYDRGEKPKRNNAKPLSEVLNLPKLIKTTGTMRRL